VEWTMVCRLLLNQLHFWAWWSHTLFVIQLKRETNKNMSVMQYWIQISKNKIFRTFICSTFIWSTHLSAGPIFQRFWFLSWFHWKRVAVNKKATVPSVPSDYYFERFKVATMNWLIVTDYTCPKRPRICSVYRNQNAVLSAFMTCHRVHLRFWWVRVARSLVFCVVFCISLFVLLRCL
jgi:hypothetical protein